MARMTTPPATLLGDPDVRRWYENLARGSRATADINLRRLSALCDSLGVTPAALARLEEKQLHDRFLDFVSTEEKREVAGSYIVRTLKAGKSWLLHNGTKLNRPIKVRGAKDTPSLKDERVPTQEELRGIMLAGTARIRVACALVAFAGLRPEVLGNYIGTDGLTLADFPELKISNSGVEFATTPALVRVRPELSKNSNGYLSFLSAEGCEYLKQYLEERVRAGEKLGPGTDLIHPDRAGKRFIRTVNIGDAIRTAIRGAGFPWRPYVLRHYFDTQLLTAESKGKVAHDFRVYWMGHVGSIDARYTTNKRQVPKEFLEEMRAAYKRCEPFLSTLPSAGQGGRDIGTLKLLLEILGVPEGKVSEDELRDATPEELKALARRYLGQGAVLPQRVVSNGEIPKLLGEGWTFVALLEGSQAILRPPDRL
jgi:integrase